MSGRVLTNRRRLDELEARADAINLPKDRPNWLHAEWLSTLSWDDLTELERAMVEENSDILARYQSRLQDWCDR